MADIFGAFGAGRSGPGRYKKPASSRKILGVQATPTLTVIDDASAGGETASWTKNIDYTSYSYGAVISLVNGTGATRYLSTVQVRGKPVEMLQGDEGLIHDAFQDHDSIYENGERKVEWGNDSIVTMAQTNQVADYLWKEFRSKKHVYMLTLPGTRYNYEPGDWYWLTIGGAGQIEYLDAVVQVFQVETYRAAAELGSTQILLKEVQEAWKKDSTAVARFIASGRTYNRPAQFNGIFIGSQYSTDKCDVYCDGTSDEDEINVAITDLSERYGGGIVHLTRGTFKTDGAIVMKSGVTLFMEAGCVIEKNYNGNGITATGGSGTELENISIIGGKITRNAADTNANKLIYFTYVDGFVIKGVTAYDSYQDGIYVDHCDGGVITENIVDTFEHYGIVAATCTQVKITENRVVSGDEIGIYSSAGSNNVIANNTIKDLVEAANAMYGIAITGPYTICSNNVIDHLTNNGNTVSAIYSSGNYNQVLSNNISLIQIAATASGMAAIYIDGTECVVQGNTIENVAHKATGQINCILGNGANINIIGNTIKTVSRSGPGATSGAIYGILLQVAGGIVSNNVINDLDINNGSNAASVFGIDTTSSATNMVIANNQLDGITITAGTGTTYGIRTDGDGLNVTSNNVINVDDYGIFIVADDNTVSANYITGCDTGIEIDTTADRTVLTGNRATANTSDNLDDNGTNTTDSGNDWA